MTKAVDEELERLLKNWAAWRLSANKMGGIPPSPAYSLVPPSPRYESRIPVLAGDAEEMDRIIVGPPGIPLRYQKVLQMHYLWSHQPERWRVANCTCSRSVYFERLAHARGLVRAEFTRRVAIAGDRAASVRSLALARVGA